MKILELKAMRGPNYWSNYRQHLIVMKLDLEELEREPTHKIEGFLERIKSLLPSLSGHHCSEGRQGGFFERVEQGTWMGHVIEHIALEIQSMAGMEVGYGRTRSTKVQGVYYVVFAYRVEEAGRYAARAAVRIADALVHARHYDLGEDLRQLSAMYRRDRLGPSTFSIVEEARRRNIPFKRLNRNSLILLGHGNKVRKIRATVADSTAGIGIEIAKNKDETKQILQSAHIPTPRGVLVYDEEDLNDGLPELNFPLVLKPFDGNHGRGISVNVISAEEALHAFRVAAEVSTPVIMEEFIPGKDYRLVLVNYKLVAAARRVPAMVVGDGFSTVLQLIEKVNSDPRRGEGHEKVLTKITVDEVTLDILFRRNMTTGSVLAEGQELYLKHTANISTGGTAEDVTEMVHPYNIFLAERVSRMLNLNICGIDVVAEDISQPLAAGNGGIVEVNAGPGLRMHHFPAKGLPRNVARPIIEMLFPGEDDGRIPLVAITGTNGKTTTTRLVAHLAATAGYSVGFNTSDGIYIQGHCIFQGDCTGPVSVETVLHDPTVNFAVLECARGGIIRSGLAFDTSDISIVTNVSADHIGLKDIDSVEEMAKVKVVVPRTTRRQGYAILNADDDLVYGMKDELDCNIALFSILPDNPRVTEHCTKGGLAALLESGYITICQGQWKTHIEKISQIPLAFGGRAENMIKNLLPMALVGTIRNMGTELIKKAMLSFTPGPELTPGRMNVFHFPAYEVLLDYAHNVDGFNELSKFLLKTSAAQRIGVIGVPGDRRNEDIVEMGRISARTFDRIIFKHDRDLRGRERSEIETLFGNGLMEIKRDFDWEISDSESEAIRRAADQVNKGGMVVICADNIHACIAQLREMQNDAHLPGSGKSEPGNNER